jgi:glycine/D-amino acid oxidase-like deaminating enzyme
VKVVLVEAAQIGRGNSGSSAGWISEDPGIAFVDLEKALGLRGARRAWQAGGGRRSTSPRCSRRLEVKCDLDARPP